MTTPRFEYIKGAASTNTPWFRPKPELLNAWREDFFKIPNVSKYRFWVCGGVLEGWKTWDTDILVTGNVESYEELQAILISSTELGFKHRQLIDINWNNSYENQIIKGACKRRGICCEHYYEHGWCEMEHCIVPRSTETIVIATEVVKNGEILSSKSSNAVRIGSSLWRRKINMPSKKQIERIRKGVIYRSRPVEITPDIDFTDVIGQSNNWRTS